MVYVHFTGEKKAAQLLASHANSAHIVVLIDLNKFWGFHVTDFSIYHQHVATKLEF